MKAKPPQEERRLIVDNPIKRPFGAKARIHLRDGATIQSPEGVCVSLAGGQFLTLMPARKAPSEGGDKYSLKLEGFRTASEAEAAGRRLAQAVLWTAVSLNFSLRLEYNTFEPVVVFDRTMSKGFQMSGYGVAGWSLEKVLDELREAYASLPEPSPRILLAMEIFAGAQLDAGDRSRFISLVSAFEPLADARSLGSEVNSFVDEVVVMLESTAAMPAAVRQSLKGRILQLRMESIRQAILRVVREALPKMPTASAIADEAYAVRSQMAHSGRPADFDLDLPALTRAAEGVLRALFSSLLSRPLLVPTAPG